MTRRLKEASRNPWIGAACKRAYEAQRRRLDRGEQVGFDQDAEVGLMLEVAAQGASITWADDVEK